MNPDPSVPSVGITASVIIPKSRVARPADPSQYIRTYAKDLAQATGENPVPPSSTASAIKVSSPEPTKTRVNISPPTPVAKSNVAATGTMDELFARSDTSVRDGVGSAQETPVQQVFTTSKSDEDIFTPITPLPPTAPAVTPPANFVNPVPVPTFVTAARSKPAPTLPKVPTYNPPAPDNAQQRSEKEAAYKESILARLRAMAQQKKPEVVPAALVKDQPPAPHREINLLNAQSAMANATYSPQPKTTPFTAVSVPVFNPPLPKIPVPEPAPLPEPKRVIEPAPEPARAPVPVPEAVLTPTYTPPSVPESSSPLHTYSSDFADHIDERRATTFSVLAAQQDSTSPSPIPRSSEGSRRLLPILAAVFLLIIGIGIAGGAFYLFGQKNVMPFVAVPPPSLIPFDESAELTGNGTELQGVLAAKAKELLLANNVLLTYVTESTTTADGANQIPQPGGFLISRLSLGAPDILLRNVDPSSTVGVIHAGGQTAPFFLLKVNSYERTFAGMLAWEPTMTNDLSLFYPSYPAPAIQQPTIATTSTPTSTPATKFKAASGATTQTATVAPQTVNPLFTPGFIDTVVSNRNVREYRDAYGNIVLIYGYADKQTLILARNADAFSALLARLPGGK